MTFTLDRDTAGRLEEAAELLDTSRSEVVRKAVREYVDRIGELSPSQRKRMLQALDELLPRIPTRSVEEVERELREIRESRRAGGRRTSDGAEA